MPKFIVSRLERHEGDAVRRYDWINLPFDSEPKVVRAVEVMNRLCPANHEYTYYESES